MSRGPDAGTLLRRALERDAAAQGCAVAVAVTGMTRWASATFVGARHRLVLEGPATGRFDSWIALLPETDLPLRHHLVADMAVIGVVRDAGSALVTVEALTVEE